MQAIADHVVGSLLKYGWAVVDRFVGIKHATAMLDECRSMYASGQFSDSQLYDQVQSIVVKIYLFIFYF
jgi:hypothetical protein